MGTVGRQILKLDTEALVEELNRGIAAELSDAFRYLLLSKMVTGPRSQELGDMFSRMSASEWSHMGGLVERVIQLGGRPMVRPAMSEAYGYAPYHEPPPDCSDVSRIIEETLPGERAAIQYWQALFERTQHDDPVTAALASSALADEVRDEDNLERVMGGRR